MDERVLRSRAWFEIDKAALLYNTKLLQGCLPANCRLMPAVKANAYGHGMLEVARILSDAGIRDFCVASLQEAIDLRTAGIPGDILILGYTDPEMAAEIAHYDLQQAAVDVSYAKALNSCAIRAGKRVKVHLAIDTGMHRIGECPDRVDAIAELFSLQGISVTGMFSHLCVSDEPAQASKDFTRLQADRFNQIVCNLIKKGLKPGKRHLCASCGILHYAAFCSDLELARPGIALYGLLSARSELADCPVDLKPVLSIRARVAQVRDLDAGDRAGYGLAFCASARTRLATVTIGYSDGVPRALSNGNGFVTIRGKRAGIAGRICMDQLLVDASEIPDVCAGDVVTLIGNKPEDPTVYDMADVCGTITNEIVSRLSIRPPRIVV